MQITGEPIHIEDRLGGDLTTALSGDVESVCLTEVDVGSESWIVTTDLMAPRGLVGLDWIIKDTLCRAHLFMLSKVWGSGIREEERMSDLFTHTQIYRN